MAFVFNQAALAELAALTGDPIPVEFAPVASDDQEDLIIGSTGDDTFVGGADEGVSDLFVLGDGNDVVEDYEAGVDTLGVFAAPEEISNVKFSLNEEGNVVVEADISTSDEAGGEYHMNTELRGVTNTADVKLIASNVIGDFDGVQIFPSEDVVEQPQPVISWPAAVEASSSSAAAPVATVSEEKPEPQRPYVIYGSTGDDILTGSESSEVFFSGVGNDTLYGGEGNDVFYSGNGFDHIITGDGQDTVVLSKNKSYDVVHDFNITEDVLTYSNLASLSFYSDDQNMAILDDGNLLAVIANAANMEDQIMIL